MRLEAMAITMPDVADHPNRIPFEGVLTIVDEASTRPPSGARGHRVILTREAARAALPSLLGMAVDFAPKWDGHDARMKCGIITEADVVGNQLRVSGYLFGRDFPEVVQQIKQSTSGTMGMSYELADAQVSDMRAEVWTLTRATLERQFCCGKKQRIETHRFDYLLIGAEICALQPARHQQDWPQEMHGGSITNNLGKHNEGRKCNGDGKHFCLFGRKRGTPVRRCQPVGA
jgi:hypothetical protein